MKNSQKGSVVLVLSIIIVLLVVAFGVYVYLQNSQTPQKLSGSQTVTQVNQSQKTSNANDVNKNIPTIPQSASKSYAPVITNVTSGKYTKFPNDVVLGEYWDLIDGKNLSTITSAYVVPISGGSKISLNFDLSTQSATTINISFQAQGLTVGRYYLYVVNPNGTSNAQVINVLAD